MSNTPFVNTTGDTNVARKAASASRVMILRSKEAAIAELRLVIEKPHSATRSLRLRLAHKPHHKHYIGACIMHRILNSSPKSKQPAGSKPAGCLSSLLPAAPTQAGNCVEACAA